MLSWMAGLASCDLSGPTPEAQCTNTALTSVTDNAELMVAAGRTFMFLPQARLDPSGWQKDDLLQICSDLEPHVGAPQFRITNTRRNETLMASEQTGDQ